MVLTRFACKINQFRPNGTEEGLTFHFRRQSLIKTGDYTGEKSVVQYGFPLLYALNFRNFAPNLK